MSGRNILVADDDPEILQLLEETLQLEGHQVTLASNGQEAVDRVKDNSIDLAVLDVNMPVMDGLSALRSIKEFDEGVAALIITGHADVNSLRQAVGDNGAIDYIIKPFQKSELIRSVSNALLSKDFSLKESRLRKELLDHIGHLEETLEEKTLQLRESQIKHKQIVENANDAIVVAQDWRFRFFNSKAIDLFGYSAEEILERPFLDLLHPEDRPMVERMHKKRLKGEKLPSTYPFRVLRKNGETVWVEISAVWTLWEERPATLNFLRDITDRKLAEDAIRESESRYRNLVQHAPAGIFELDLARMKFLSVNEVMCDYTGYTMEEFLNLNPIHLVSKDHKAHVSQAYNASLSSKKEVEYVEFKLKTKKDTDLWIMVRNRYIYEGDEPIKVHAVAHDITERKHMEEALRESEEKSKAISASAQDAILLMNDEGNITFWNDAASKMFGLSQDQAIGKELHKLLAPPRYRKLFEESFPKFQETGQGNATGKTLELSALSHDGTEFPIELSLSSVRMKEKWHAVGIIRDTSKRKHAEEQLHRQKATLEAINTVLKETLRCETEEEVAQICLDVALDLTKSKLGWIGELNDTERLDTIAQSDSGWEACKIPKSNAVRMIRNMEVRGIWGRVLKDEHSVIVNDPTLHPDSVGIPEGHPPLTSFLGVPLKNAGKTIGMVALGSKESGYESFDQLTVEALAVAFVEALNRKRAEAYLRESEERYRTVIENSNDGVAITQEGHCLYVNSRYLEIFGYDRADEVLGRPWKSVVHPDEMRRMEDIARRRREGIAAPSRYEFRGVRKDGKVLNIEMSVAETVYRGNPITVDSLRDVTDRKRLESQLAQAQKLESIGQLAAGIAHEINTPTQYIGDNVRFLQDAFNDIGRVLEKYDQLLDAVKTNMSTENLILEADSIKDEVDVKFLIEEVPEATEQALEGVDRVGRIVRALKEFAHPGSEEKTPVDINRAIESTITVARSEWKYVAEMETEFDPTLKLVPCLPGEFNQVILNLIINAAHAIGDVVSTGSNGMGKITVSTLQNGPWAEIRIGDTGPGIPSAIKSKIFDPFFTTKEVGKGTGQGLAIAYSAIVDKHQGTIEFETEHGKGTTFIVRIPIEDTRMNDSL
jgi:PAS domain S-box-containing protein